MNTKKSVLPVKKIVMIAMLSAISVILLMIPFLRMPLLPAAPFLEYDAMDIPILVGGFLFGPVVGIAITAISALIQGATVSSGSGIYGIIMHFIATGAFVFISSLVYRKMKSTKGLVLGLIVGVIAMVLIMIPSNLLVTPLFMGTPREVVLGMILPVIIPFNLLKASINAVAVFALFKVIKKPLQVYVDKSK